MTTLTCTCDLCFVRTGRYIEATHRRVRIRINEERGVLDLCESHHEQLLLPVLEAIADRQEDDASLPDRNRRYGPIQCKVPGCGAVLKHTGTLWQHLQLKHKTVIAQYRAEYGDPVPMTAEEVAAAVVEASCKVCGKTYSTERGHRFPQSALVPHLRARHALNPDYTPIEIETF
jgi:hypothetical protein